MVLNWGRRILGGQGGAAAVVASTLILWPNLANGPIGTRVTQQGVEPITQSGVVRVTQQGVEPVTQSGAVRITQFGVEVVSSVKGVRITQFGVETVTQAGGMRVTQVGAEVISGAIVPPPGGAACEMQIPNGDGGAICTDEMGLPADSGGGTAEP